MAATATIKIFLPDGMVKMLTAAGKEKGITTAQLIQSIFADAFEIFRQEHDPNNEYGVMSITDDSISGMVQ